MSDRFKLIVVVQVKKREPQKEKASDESEAVFFFMVRRPESNRSFKCLKNMQSVSEYLHEDSCLLRL